MAYGLTKAQRKNRDRIEAWLKNEKFTENSKAKPAIPNLGIDDVLEQYIPLYASDTGSFFTPAEMAWHLHSYAHIWAGSKVLDPCAGIGNLLYPIHDDQDIEIHAWELSLEQYEVGKRLFPQYHWRQGNAYEIIAEYEGYFDTVIMNPPFNITWATSVHESKLVSKATKSEHMMLEVALRALKPGGMLYVIAPWNYIAKIPKICQQWLLSRMDNICDLGELPGEFELTKISVHGYQIERVPVDGDLPPVTSAPTGELQPMFTPAPETAPAIAEPSPINGNGAEEIEYPKHAVILPLGIYEALRLLDGGTYLFSPTKTAAQLKKLEKKEAGAWVEKHPTQYGVGFYNGFYSDEQPLLDLSSRA